MSKKPHPGPGKWIIIRVNDVTHPDASTLRTGKATISFQYDLDATSIRIVDDGDQNTDSTEIHFSAAQASITMV